MPPIRVSIRTLTTCALLGAWTVLAEAQPRVPAADAPAARSSAHAYLRAGDEAYRAGDYAAAELEYRRAAAREPSYRAHYNLGVALARLGRQTEATEQFERARTYAAAEGELADAAYNLGNAHAEDKKLEESVRGYVDALRANPNDLEAKENLARVLRMLRVRQQQQQQQQQQQEGEPSEDQSEAAGDPPPPSEPEGDAGDPPPGDGSEDDRPEEAGERERQQDDPEPADAPDGDERDAQTAGDPEEDLDREEAERLLELARERERRTQEKVKLGERQPRKLEKDW